VGKQRWLLRVRQRSARQVAESPTAGQAPVSASLGEASVAVCFRVIAMGAANAIAKSLGAVALEVSRQILRICVGPRSSAVRSRGACVVRRSGVVAVARGGTGRFEFHATKKAGSAGRTHSGSGQSGDGGRALDPHVPSVPVDGGRAGERSSAPAPLMRCSRELLAPSTHSTREHRATPKEDDDVPAPAAGGHFPTGDLVSACSLGARGRWEPGGR
jgi:hypothetical protein